MGYTPGPWSVIKRLSDLQSGLDYYVGLPDRRLEKNDFSLAYAEEHVAHVFAGSGDIEANARLIAAAPALLEELQHNHPGHVVGDRYVRKLACQTCAVIMQARSDG